MAHQLVLVLIANPNANVAEQVEALISKHSFYAETEPWKQYFEPCHWNGRLWEMEDVEEFVRQWREAIGTQYEKDDKGYYLWRDENREGHYDWYTIGGRWDGVFAGCFTSGNSELSESGSSIDNNICLIRDLPKDFGYPGSFVTPDGVWHFFGWRFRGEDPDARNIEIMRQIVAQYGDYYAVAVDTHS
jgi:hypothetical protein